MYKRRVIIRLSFADDNFIDCNQAGSRNIYSITSDIVFYNIIMDKMIKASLVTENKLSRGSFSKKILYQ